MVFTASSGRSYRSDLDLPAGKVQTAQYNNTVRLTGKFATIQDIKNVQTAMPIPGSPVYVKDVALVVDGVKEIASYSRYNGKSGIGLLLKKQGDANAVNVSSLVRDKFKNIEEQNSNANVQFIIADDSTDNTIDTYDGGFRFCNAKFTKSVNPCFFRNFLLRNPPDLIPTF